MFNNVILDVAIGIVFIFLLYSLLATSIQEGIATLLGLRARTLKDGIVNGMLCNTPNISRWESIGKGIWDTIKEVWYMLGFKRPPVTEKKLGHQFYDHPLIKNYGSNQIFPTPSYIPTTNFSTVLIDLFKEDFVNKLDRIAQHKFETQSGTQTLQQITDTLKNSPDVLKVKELLAYYKDLYAGKVNAALPDNLRHIEEETLRILIMHFNNSVYRLEDFEKKLEDWFDDTMNRVTGWYKRRTQFILFAIGIVLAIVFNVDVIQIAGKLSTDKDAREQMVQMAIKKADDYKDDPRVKKLSIDTSKKTIDSLTAIKKGYDKAVDDARNTIDSGIVKANQLLALGWGDYGMRLDSQRIINAYLAKYPELIKPDSAKVMGYLADTTVIDDDEKVTGLLTLLAIKKQDTTVRKTIANALVKGKIIITDARVKTVVDTFKTQYANYKPAPVKPVVKDTAAKAKADAGKNPMIAKQQAASNKSALPASSLKAILPVAKKQQADPFAQFAKAYIPVRNQEILESEYGFWHCLWYLIRQCFGRGRKFIGLLITAVAICLGAPFWFDTLNKLIKLRGSGKKEDSDNTSTDPNASKAATPAQQGVNVNVGTTANGEVAVG